MRVVLAEDNVLLREGVARVLRDGGFEVVGAVGDATALLDLVADSRPDIAIVDIRMPPTFTDEGLRAAEALLAASPPTPVVVLSQAVEPAHAVRLLADGRTGVGYLLKDRVADADELLDAARRVAGGGSAIDPAVIDEVVRSRATQERLAVLTAREREVLELIAEGKSNRSIGERLAISVKTVEAQVATIFSKLGLEADPDDNRRVLAVLVYLEGRG